MQSSVLTHLATRTSAAFATAYTTLALIDPNAAASSGAVVSKILDAGVAGALSLVVLWLLNKMVSNQRTDFVKVIQGNQQLLVDLTAKYDKAVERVAEALDENTRTLTQMAERLEQLNSTLREQRAQYRDGEKQGS